MAHPDLLSYQSHKIVQAGRITEIVPVGCFVQTANPDDTVLLIYEGNMTSRYQPQVGDYWVIYEDGYQALSPRAAFEEGYDPIEQDKA
jgi:hypothetical protein